MSQKAGTGKNRTGAGAVPDRLDAMVAGTREFPPSSEGSARDIAAVRIAYAAESEPAGHVPPPLGPGKRVKTMAKETMGAPLTELVDRLGERLAFERTGTRLYEALLSKHEAYGSFEAGPTRDDLERILAEEHRHFGLLRAAVARLGGDPTAVTPSANLHATASKGIGDVLVDPRTSLLDGLEAILLAELADGEGWDTLLGLTREAGEREMTSEFEKARAAEEEHLRSVRAWIAAAQRRGATGPPSAGTRRSSAKAAVERSPRRRAATRPRVKRRRAA
jgi:rubrerythrin